MSQNKYPPFNPLKIEEFKVYLNSLPTKEEKDKYFRWVRENTDLTFQFNINKIKAWIGMINQREEWSGVVEYLEWLIKATKSMHLEYLSNKNYAYFDFDTLIKQLELELVYYHNLEKRKKEKEDGLEKNKIGGEGDAVNPPKETPKKTTESNEKSITIDRNFNGTPVETRRVLKDRFYKQPLSEKNIQELEHITKNGDWSDSDKGVEIFGTSREYYCKRRIKFMGKKST